MVGVKLHAVAGDQSSALKSRLGNYSFTPKVHIAVRELSADSKSKAMPSGICSRWLPAKRKRVLGCKLSLLLRDTWGDSPDFDFQ